jgi:hypothetical protein
MKPILAICFSSNETFAGSWDVPYTKGNAESLLIAAQKNDCGMFWKNACLSKGMALIENPVWEAGRYSYVIIYTEKPNM